MAGGGSPRQKMINLMYVVFIAMTAMNMSKEVLGAFGAMTVKMEDSNIKITQANKDAYESIVQKSAENDTYKEALKKAEEVKKLSSEYYEFLADLKDQVLYNGLAKDDPKRDEIDITDYQVMDKSDYLDSKLFGPEGITQDGQDFYNRYTGYRDRIIDLIKDDKDAGNLVSTLRQRFEDGGEVEGNEKTKGLSSGQVKDRDGNTLHWLNAKLEGYPSVAAITFLTQIQSDIKKTEQDVYGALVGAGMKEQVSMKHYTTLLELAKGAFYTNQTFDGSIVLGRKDNSTKPKRVDLKVDGRKLSPSEYSIEEGKIALKFNTGNVGEHKITGTLFYEQDGVETPVEVDKVYTTIPRPNEAVISADKMNVVYVGVDNPMTISMPGVSDNLVNASAAGLRKTSGSSYIMRPTPGQKEVTINVTGSIEGERFSSSKKFRVKSLPKPEGAIFGKTGAVSFPASNIQAGQVTVVYDNFDFDLKTTVTSFTILVDGERVVVQGNRVSANERAVKAIARAKRGSVVQFSDIKYKVTGFDGVSPPATPISVEIK